MLSKIPFTRFMKMKTQEIGNSKSFIVTSNGSLLFMVIVPRTPYVEQAVEELGVLSNSVGGNEVSE